MRMWAGLVCVLICALVPAVNCIEMPNGRVCTTLYAYGLSATVKDATTGAPIDNAILTLREGDYVEVMQLLPTGSYAGAGERPGTYDLTIEVPGVATDTISDIEITADECHVQGIALDIQVAPGEVRVGGPIACTADIRVGARIHVTNAQSNQPITNAILTLTEGSYSEQMGGDMNGVYYGASERRGTYTLTVEAPGFASQMIDNVVVTRGLCHVNTARLDVALQSAQ